MFITLLKHSVKRRYSQQRWMQKQIVGGEQAWHKLHGLCFTLRACLRRLRVGAFAMVEAVMPFNTMFAHVA